MVLDNDGISLIQTKHELMKAMVRTIESAEVFVSTIIKEKMIIFLNVMYVQLARRQVYFMINSPSIQ